MMENRDKDNNTDKTRPHKEHSTPVCKIIEKHTNIPILSVI